MAATTYFHAHLLVVALLNLYYSSLSSLFGFRSDHDASWVTTIRIFSEEAGVVSVLLFHIWVASGGVRWFLKECTRGAILFTIVEKVIKEQLPMLVDFFNPIPTNK